MIKIAHRWTWLATVAVLAAGLGIVADASTTNAQASCRGSCLAKYNQCRIATKGSPSCDAQYRNCLQGCIKGRR